MLIVAFVVFISAVGAHDMIPRVIYHNSSTGMVFSFVETPSEAYSLFQLIQHAPALVLIFAIMVLGSIVMAERAIIPIKLSWRRQQEFVADASHELRTPLATIKSNLEVVMENPSLSVESRTKWLENIDIEVNRITSLVTHLLLLARIDSNQEMLEENIFMVAEAVACVLRPFEAETKKRGITLNYIFDGKDPYYGDEARIRQLVVILVDNAIKCTSPGGTITITVKSFIQQVDISVADTGIGIPEHDLATIFRRFYRGDPARNSAKAGTGLGLSIAEWIVKAHGGVIRVVSHLEEGTVFYVNFPQRNRQ
jgi:two-component system sensor histidine kinase CiaH